MITEDQYNISRSVYEFNHNRKTLKVEKCLHCGNPERRPNNILCECCFQKWYDLYGEEGASNLNIFIAAAKIHNYKDFIKEIMLLKLGKND